MADTRTITLGDRQIPVPPIPLGRVRKLPVVCTRIYAKFAAGIFDDALSDDILKVLALGTGMSEAELDEVPAEFPQLQEAVDTIVQVAGLKTKGSPEAAKPGEGSTPATTQIAGGTTFTPTSTPEPAGPGTTSTSG